MYNIAINLLEIEMKKILSLTIIVSVIISCLFALSSCDGAECNHEWSEWRTVEESTCSKGGYRIRECKLCGEQARSVDYPTDHTYSDEWKYDGAAHWHPAVCIHTNQTSGYELHNFVGNTCSICHALKASQGLSYRGDLALGTYIVTGVGTTLDAEIVVARYFSGFEITAVDPEAFSGVAGLKSVWLQQYITSVGDRAFANSPDLVTVTITLGTEYLGSRLFDGCDSLERVVFRGLVEEFNAIEKAEDWDSGASGYIIECFDGTIEK